LLLSFSTLSPPAEDVSPLFFPGELKACGPAPLFLLWFPTTADRISLNNLPLFPPFFPPPWCFPKCPFQLPSAPTYSSTVAAVDFSFFFLSPGISSTKDDWVYSPPTPRAFVVPHYIPFGQLVLFGTVSFLFSFHPRLFYSG